MSSPLLFWNNNIFFSPYLLPYQVLYGVSLVYKSGVGCGGGGGGDDDDDDYNDDDDDDYDEEDDDQDDEDNENNTDEKIINKTMDIVNLFSHNAYLFTKIQKESG